MKTKTIDGKCVTCKTTKLHEDAIYCNACFAKRIDSQCGEPDMYGQHAISYDGKPAPKEVCAYCLTHESVGHKPGCGKPQHAPKAENTPTPWIVAQNGDILPEKGPCLFRCTWRSIADVQRDAAFIVRAVNAHEDLLKELKLWCHAFEDRPEVTSGLLYKKSMEAIAKAEGK